MKKLSIPPTTSVKDQQVKEILQAVAVNVEILTGRRGGQITPLTSGATLQDVINKVNELLTRMQE